MSGHRIEQRLLVPVFHDGEKWSAEDQAFGLALEFDATYMMCPKEHDNRGEGSGGCVKAAEAAEADPLDAWELTQLLAKAHGAVVIGARELESLRRMVLESDRNDTSMAILAGFGDSNDDEIEAGQIAVDIHSQMTEILRGLSGFEPDTGPELGVAYDRQVKR